MDVAAELAASAASTTFESLPAEVVESVRRFTLSTLGGALAGIAVGGSEPVVELFSRWGGAQESTVFGSAIRLPAPDAALLNAMFAQASDYDDIHDRALVRPFSIVVPSALAVAEHVGSSSGRDYIAATAAAVDITCRLGLAVQIGTLRWARPATLGTFGAAVVCAKLLGLDAARTVDALGIAYSQAAGNTQAMIDRALVKRVQPGFAARAGVTAGFLAARGLTGATNVFEGQNGYFSLYEGGRCDRARITERLGEYNHALGVSMKPYPCAAETHAAIDAALALAIGNDIHPEQINAIVIRVPPLVFDIGARPYPPKDGSIMVAAFASLAYAVATAILHRSVGLANYTEAAASDPRALKLVALTTVESEPSSGPTYFVPATVEITTFDGNVFRKTATTVRGYPDNPLSWDEVVEKFRSCCEFTSPEVELRRQNAIIERVAALETLSNVGEIAALLGATAQ